MEFLKNSIFFSINFIIFVFLMMMNSSTVQSGSSVVNFDPPQLQKDVTHIVKDFFPRDYQHPENLAALSQWIQGEMKAAGLLVSLQEYVVQGKKYYNVIGTWGPPNMPRIVVGAHYDAFESLPGADDNASGVAGLLALARELVKTSPRYQLEFVAYTLEEEPHFATVDMGSARHASWLKEQGLEVRAMICLEMIGYFSNQSHSQDYPLPFMRFLYSSVGNFIGVVGNFSNHALTKQVRRSMSSTHLIPVKSLSAPGLLVGVDYSDHRSYWQEGYPAVMVTNTAFYRNHSYHTEKDTPDTLDYQRMASVLSGVHQAVLDLQK
jgi:hypothetical protein